MKYQTIFYKRREIIKGTSFDAYSSRVKNNLALKTPKNTRMALVKAIYVCLLFYSAAIGESQSSKEDLNSEKRVLNNQDVQAKANAQLLVDSVRRATNTGSK